MRTSTLAAMVLLMLPAVAGANDSAEDHRIDGVEGRLSDAEMEVLKRSTRFYVLGGTWGHLRQEPDGSDGYRTFGGAGFGLAEPVLARRASCEFETRFGLSENLKTGVILTARVMPALKSGFQAGGVLRKYWDTKHAFDLVDHGLGLGATVMYTLTRVNWNSTYNELSQASVVLDLTLGGNDSKVVGESIWTPGVSLALRYLL